MKKRAISLFLIVAMAFAFVPYQGMKANAAAIITTANYSAMLARAEAVVNYTWTPMQNIATWNGTKYNGSTVFKKGTTVKGMPYTLFTYELNVDSLLSLEQYKAVVAKNRTATAKCISMSNASRTGPVYGSCCATFVSEIFGGSFMNGKNPRYDSVYGIQDSPYAKHILNAKAGQIQVGDALSTKTNASHVIWVGGITDTSYIIYEQTPPVARKVVVDKASHTDANGYFWYGTKNGNKIYYKTINRINVNLIDDKTPPVISDVKVTEVKEGEGYTVSCKVTDNVGAVKVQFPSWSQANGQDDLASGWDNATLYAGEQNGNTYTYTVKLSDHKNEAGTYLTHIYAWDGVGNCATYKALPAVEVKDKPAAITTQPKDVTADEGEQVLTYVKANGTGLTYQWQLSDDQGKTWRNSSVTTSYYYNTLTDKNDGRYLRCIVTDKYGNTVTSQAAVMRIKKAITITTQPRDVSGAAGDSLMTYVKATGDGLTYQWQLSDDEGTTWRSSSVKTSYYYTTLTAQNSGRYLRCVITDKDGHKVTSNAAVMRLNAPTITEQPANVTGVSGSTVTLKVAATGDGLTYQWQLSDDRGKTWRNSSTKSATYSTTLSSTNDGRYLRCIVTDKYGSSVTSDTAVMSIKKVEPAIVITTQPRDISGDVGDSLMTYVKATGSGLTYQWQLSDDRGKSWRNSSVKTSYYYATLTAQNSGRYLRCVITDKNGSKVTSNAAVMKFNSLTITTQPSDVTDVLGSTVTLKVAANGSGLSYQWQLSDDQGKTWRNSSTKSATYSTTLSSTNNGRYLRCIITDKNGSSITSKSAVIRSKAAITITVQPKNMTGNVGDSLTTSVRATGNGLNYQWQLSDDEGQTWRSSSVKTSYYSTTITELNHGRYLRCIITDKYGNKVTSHTAVMTIQ